MYFLAFLLTLRVLEPVRHNHSFGDAHELLWSQPIPPDTDAYLREGRIRVALLKRDHESVHVRLTCFSAGEHAPGSVVLQALTPGSELRYAGQKCVVESVDLTDPLWTGVGTWTDMLGQSPGVRMRFTFATPLITADPAKRLFDNALPFPDPQILFASALRHWRLLDGPLLPYSGVGMTQIARCVVSEYRLETADSMLAGHSYTGFLGWIEYVCRTRESSVIVSLNALTRLAFYSGSGYLTERGLGVTTVKITN
jgi:CRISPR-associated endoribonuclease Cas6